MKRLVAFSVLPVALAAVVFGVTGMQRAAAAPAAPQASPTCILGILCLGSSSPSPSPSSSSTSASPSPTSASPSPTPSTSASAGPSPSAGPTPSVTASGTASPSGSPGSSPSASASGKPGSRKKVAEKKAANTAGLVVSSATTVLSADSATFTNLIYDGNVDMPVAGGGTVTMMKFTADSITLSGDVSFSITQDGLNVAQTGDTFAFSGGVTFYATQMSGSFLGVPLTFTPSTVSAVLLTIVANPVTDLVIPSLTLTSTTADQPVTTAGSVQYTPLSVGFGG
jgi:hypothetical protein